MNENERKWRKINESEWKIQAWTFQAFLVAALAALKHCEDHFHSFQSAFRIHENSCVTSICKYVVNWPLTIEAFKRRWNKILNQPQQIKNVRGRPADCVQASPSSWNTDYLINWWPERISHSRSTDFESRALTIWTSCLLHYRNKL